MIVVMSKLVKDAIKFNGLSDWNNALSSLWCSDNSRPWDIYSKETFRRFLDDRNTVDRSR